MDVDAATGTIYLPTAEFAPVPPGGDTRRPPMKPDTFMIVVVRASAQ